MFWSLRVCPVCFVSKRPLVFWVSSLAPKKRISLSILSTIILWNHSHNYYFYFWIKSWTKGSTPRDVEWTYMKVEKQFNENSPINDRERGDIRINILNVRMRCSTEKNDLYIYYSPNSIPNLFTPTNTWVFIYRTIYYRNFKT